jgi:hypothetical protein
VRDTEGGALAKPLRAITKDGRRYTRRPDVEAEIDRSIGQPLEVIRQRLLVASAQSPDYLNSECVMHLLREAFEQDDSERAGVLYDHLMRRVERIVYAKVDGRLNVGDIYDAVAHDLNLLLTQRLSSLDYYEVNFSAAVRKNYLTKISHARNSPNSVAFDEQIRKPDPMSSEGHHEERSAQEIDFAAAIRELSPSERKAFVHVVLHRHKIESKDPSEPTAANVCGVSGRMIRKYLDSAKRKLATHLENYQP